MIALLLPRRRHLRWLFVAALLGVIVAVASGGPPQLVSAHALLVKADPPVNATLRDPPSALILYFSEAVEHKFSNVQVKDQTNARVDNGFEFDPGDNTVIHVALNKIGPGFLAVYWATVSAVDGHRVSGSYPLTILNADGSVPAGKPATAVASTSGTGANPVRAVVKLVLLLAAAALTGALVFMTFVTPALPGLEGEQTRTVMDRHAIRFGIVALLGLAAAGVVELLLQASNVGSGARDVLGTYWGYRWLLRNLVLVEVAFALLLCTTLSATRRSAAAAAGIAGCLVYLGAIATVSHGGAGGGAFWAVASDCVHLVSASVWIGLLFMLVLLFLWARTGLVRGEKYPVLAAALQRFSTVAVVSVALLFFTGVVNSVIEVDSISDLTSTGYGRALLIKLILIVPLLAIGSVNAYTLRPSLVDTAGRSNLARAAELEARLSRTIRYELFFAVAILAVVAVLVQISPSRGKIAAPPHTGKFTASKDAVNGIAATLVVDPNQAGGVNTFEVYLTGQTNVVQSVRLDFSQPGKSGTDSRADMTATNPPTFYVAQGPFLAQPGKWNIGVDILVTQGKDLLIPFVVPVGGAGVAPTAARHGGTFAVPVSVGWTTWLLIGVSGALAAGLVIGSRPRGALPDGYVGRLAATVNERVSLRAMRPAWSLALLIAVGIVLGLLLGSHAHPKLSQQQAVEGNPVPSNPASIQRGAMLFQQNCTQCHGESGRGDGPLAKSLPIPPANLYDHIPFHPDQFFFSVISNGLAGVMPGFSNQIAPEDRWNILNYLRDRFGNGPPTSEAQPTSAGP